MGRKPYIQRHTSTLLIQYGKRNMNTTLKEEHKNLASNMANQFCFTMHFAICVPRQARPLRIVKTFCCKALVNVCYHNVFRETGALRIPKYLGDDGLFEA